LWKKNIKKIKELKSFYTHIFIYALVNLTLFIINLISNPGKWWFYWVTIFWELKYIASVNYPKTGFLDQTGKIKKLKEYMEKRKNTNIFISISLFLLIFHLKN
jgi:hypothetical protein